MPIAKTKLDLQPIVEMRAVTVMKKRLKIKYKWFLFPVIERENHPVAWFLEYRRAASREWIEVEHFETDEKELVEKLA